MDENPVPRPPAPASGGPRVDDRPVARPRPLSPGRAGLLLGLLAVGIHLAAFLLPLMAGTGGRMVWLGGPFHFLQEDDWRVAFSLATDQGAGFLLTLWLGSLVLARTPQPRQATVTAGVVGGLMWGLLTGLLALFVMTFCIFDCERPNSTLVAGVILGTGVSCAALFALACRAAGVRAERRNRHPHAPEAARLRRLDLWATVTALVFAAWGPASSFSRYGLFLPVSWADAAYTVAIPVLLVGAAVAAVAYWILRNSPQPAVQAVRWGWLPAALWMAALAVAFAELAWYPEARTPLLIMVAGGGVAVFGGCLLGGQLARAAAIPTKPA